MLEKELEAFAGDWGIFQCLENSSKFRRWADELEVKAFILARSADEDSAPSLPSKRRRVARGLRCPKARLN